MNHHEEEAGMPPTPSYRYADVVGDELIVAGAVPNDAAGAIVGLGDPAAQARLCLDNLEAVIEVHGFERADIRHVTVYVVGPHENLTAAWDAVTAWFGGEVPPGTLLGVHLLGYTDQLVEVDARIVRILGSG